MLVAPVVFVAVTDLDNWNPELALSRLSKNRATRAGSLSLSAGAPRIWKQLCASRKHICSAPSRNLLRLANVSPLTGT